MNTGNPMLDRWERTFDGDGGDYMITMSHVSLSGTGVELTYEPASGGGQWVAVQRIDGFEWTARSRSHSGVVLALIAARLGLAIGDGDFIDALDEDGS